MKRDKNMQQLNGLIDRGCSLEGKLTFDGIVQINGAFQGDILSDGTLVVGSDANISGKVEVDSIIIEGCVRGVVVAKGRIELRQGARLLADISSPTLIIEDGAIFHGQCAMSGDEDAVGTSAAATIETGDSFVGEGDDSLMM
jgi:cytoskeletal protein CcmA (bactofilin family)